MSKTRRRNSGARRGERQKEEGPTILVRLSEDNHVLWENLWDSSDLGADDEETCRSRFQDGGSEGFCEGGVEEDLASDENLQNRSRRVKSATLLEKHSILSVTLKNETLTERTSRGAMFPINSIRS